MSIDYYAHLRSKPPLNIRSPGEVEQWTAVLNIYVADLVHAVDSVGDDPNAILDFLYETGKITSWPGRGSEPSVTA